MAHTLPDYSTEYRMETVFGAIDLSELAVRLGSPSLFNREGNVFWYDNFEAANLHWNATTDGLGAAVALSTASAYTGEQSLKLTAGSNLGMNAYVTRHFHCPALSSIGMETTFTSNVQMDYFYIYVAINTGARGIFAGLAYDYTNAELKYHSSAGIWTTLTAISLIPADTFAYQPMKLVFDAVSEKYVRAIWGSTTYDMSTLPLRAFNAAGNPAALFYIALYGTAGNNPYTYVDNFIVTQNEV